MTLGLVCDACDTFAPLSATACPVCSTPLTTPTPTPAPTPAAAPAKPAAVTAGRPGAAAAPKGCPNCGNEPAGPNQRFCGFCGTRLDGSELRPAWTTQPVSKTRLVLVKGEGQDGVAFPLAEGEHVAGRLEGGIMFPEDSLLSPRHATFLFRDGQLWMRDDGSINGVFIRLRGPKVVPTGTRLIVGEQLLRIDQAPPEPALIPDAEGTYFYSSPSGPARLVLTQLLVGGETGLIYRARNDNVTIGREGNDVNFPEDPFISGRHVQIRALEDGRFQVTDLSSKNGTYERIPQLVQLQQGDHVFLGQQLLRVELNAG